MVVMGSEPATAHALISHVAKAALAGRPLPVDSPFKVRGRKARLSHVPFDWVLADFTRWKEEGGLEPLGYEAAAGEKTRARLVRVTAKRGRGWAMVSEIVVE